MFNDFSFLFSFFVFFSFVYFSSQLCAWSKFILMAHKTVNVFFSISVRILLCNFIEFLLSVMPVDYFIEFDHFSIWIRGCCNTIYYLGRFLKKYEKRKKWTNKNSKVKREFPWYPRQLITNSFFFVPSDESWTRATRESSEHVRWRI